MLLQQSSDTIRHKVVIDTEWVFCTEEKCWYRDTVFLKNQLNLELPQVLPRVCFHLCLHELNNSCLELSDASLLLYIMKYFSSRQSLQTPVTGLNPLALPSILQFNWYWILLSFKNQIYLLRGNVKKKKQYICWHCPNRREGGQPHVKKFKWNNFLTKVGEGGGHTTYCQK